jgi:hypothetical protein
MVDIHDQLVPASVAHDVERPHAVLPHAVLPHVGEVHRLDWIVEALVAIASPGASCA